MAETVQGLLDAVVQEASFDVTNATALVWLNRRFKTMVSRARARRKTVAIGTVVADQAFYPVAGILELYSIEIGGVPYSKARRRDGYANSQGRLVWEGIGETGLVYEDANSSAVQGLTLIPTPTASGAAISGFAAVPAPDLTIDGPGDALVALLDDVCLEPLIAGTMATGYGREGNVGLEQAKAAQFEAGCEEYRRLVRQRYRLAGPTQIRIGGVNA